MGVPELMRTLPATLPIVTILGSEIKPVPAAKDLGVHMDLNFNEHITKTLSYCIFELTRVNRIKHFLDKNYLTYLISAFVFCKINYSTVRRFGVTQEKGMLKNFSQSRTMLAGL